MKPRIKEIAEMRGFKTAYELSERSGLSYPTADRAFRNDIKQFTPETLERLCKTLFCTPNDIFGVDADAPEYPPLTGEKPISPEQWERLSKAAQAEHEKNRELLAGKEWRDKLKEKRKEKQKNDESTASSNESYRVIDASDAKLNRGNYYNKSVLKSRGWSDAMIKNLYGAPDYLYPIQCGNMRPKYFYLKSNVKAIEKTKAFTDWRRKTKKP